jgi:hypothetical protein
MGWCTQTSNVELFFAGAGWWRGGEGHCRRLAWRYKYSHNKKAFGFGRLKIQKKENPICGQNVWKNTARCHALASDTDGT